jgi:type IV pilus assembly protein PilB
VLEVTKPLQEMIAKGSTSSEIMAVAEQEGMITIIVDGFAKAIQGITTLEEIMRVTKE